MAKQNNSIVANTEALEIARVIKRLNKGEFAENVLKISRTTYVSILNGKPVDASTIRSVLCNLENDFYKFFSLKCEPDSQDVN